MSPAEVFSCKFWKFLKSKHSVEQVELLLTFIKYILDDLKSCMIHILLPEICEKFISFRKTLHF